MSCGSVEVTMYNYIHDRYVRREDLPKAMQRLEEYTAEDKLQATITLIIYRQQVTCSCQSYTRLI